MMMLLMLSAILHVSTYVDCNANTDALVNSIFNQPPPPPATNNLPQGPLEGTGIIDIPLQSENNCPNGECVPYYLCNEDGNINRDGSGIFDVRFNSDNPAQCYDYMKVCCKDDDIRDTRETTGEFKNVGCGLHNPNGLAINIELRGSEAYLAEFPWMVAVLQKELINEREMSIYQCGGSLINPQVVLTAAHCVDKVGAGNFIARAGEWDTQTNDEIFEHQDRQIREIKIHPDYKKQSLHNDIALIYVTQPFNLAENVQTICLPPQNYNFDSNRCYASGWGKDVFGKEGRYSVIMKKVILPVVEHGQCQASLRGTRLSHRFILHESFMCAGGEKSVDTCKGDGGSPLVCPIPGVENRFYQAGIVAWGIGCGENQVPGVYVNVVKFRQWIDENLIAYNIDTNSYNHVNYNYK